MAADACTTFYDAAAAARCHSCDCSFSLPVFVATYVAREDRVTSLLLSTLSQQPVHMLVPLQLAVPATCI